ncbi:MAG: rod-binding protein [Gemmobacter sp.]
MLPPVSLPAQAAISGTEATLRRRAAELEATFLAEMLGHAGLAATTAFCGGPGEEQFASFLRRAQADAMVRAGGIGLAEQIFRSLKDRSHDGA